MRIECTESWIGSQNVMIKNFVIALAARTATMILVTPPQCGELNAAIKFYNTTNNHNRFFTLCDINGYPITIK